VWWPTREELARWYMESDETAAHRAAMLPKEDPQ
jgi:hypothetical protein